VRARSLVRAWGDVPYLLLKRLALFAHEHSAFSPAEAASVVSGLEDAVFWGNARVEIMRLLVSRWSQFSNADRLAIEGRIRAGEPRYLYAAGAFDNEDKWQSILGDSIYRRFKRIELAGVTLAAESQQLVAAIAARHPSWKPGSADRDDFYFWHEIRSGPDGQPGLLANIADERLVQEAMRLQREQYYEQGDVWRVFCAADPERALHGLELEAANDRWDPEAWRCLLSVAADHGEAVFQHALADLLLRMPAASLGQTLTAVTSWLQRRRDILSATDISDGARLLPLWDRCADLAYLPEREADAAGKNSRDLATEALNRPGGVLAWSLFDALGAPEPERDTGLDPALRPRFDRIATAEGRPGLLGRVNLARSLAYLDAIDPAWVAANLEPRLAWSHPEALLLWRSYAGGGIGSPRLFNALKPAMLAAFERQELSDDELEGLIPKLLSVAAWHQRGEEPQYNLSAAEVRRALAVGPPSARRNVSWNLWRMMEKPHRVKGAADGDEGAVVDKPTWWRTVIGPLFRDIWPLDARLRSKSTTRNFVMMVLECEAAFPEAVEAILDLVVPYELHQLAHSLRLEDKHSALVQQYPRAFVRLVNALIEPTAVRVPGDLGTFLQECVAADAAVASDPAYVRLNGLRRQLGA